MTDTDLSWGEWAKIHEVAAGGVNDASYEKIDDPPTPKVSTTRRQLFPKKSKASRAVSPIPTPTSTPTEIACPDAPKKAKTRAQRRAIDDDSVVQETALETPRKKEQRTDYWVHKDTLRMNRARNFKSVCSQLTEQTACDDEQDIILNKRKESFIFERCDGCQHEHDLYQL